VHLPSAKKIVCITGTVWTGGRSAPRRMLIRDGFVRPIWFTTGRAVSDAEYEVIPKGEYHLALGASKVLAHMEYGGDFVGLLKQDFEDAAVGSQTGVLVVGFPEIVAQIAEALPETVVFALKDQGMALSDHLAGAESRGQLHRLDVDVLAPGAWTDVHRRMLHALDLPNDPRSSGIWNKT
jgi:hypothetical protein